MNLFIKNIKRNGYIVVICYIILVCFYNVFNYSQSYLDCE